MESLGVKDKSHRLKVDFWTNRVVLVTGATGIVGSWLVKDLLAAGAKVVALVRDVDYQTEFYRSGDFHNVSVINGRIEDYCTIERAINENTVDTVFHLAAMTIVGIALRSPLACFESNLRGTYNILESCRVNKNQIKSIVIASSDKAYGDQLELPYTEDMPLVGRHPYDVSKSCADLLSQTYFNSYDIPITIARCGNIFGGGDLNWSRIVPGTIRSLLHGERPIIRSDGKYIRDYIYVKDVSNAYMRMAEYCENPSVCGQAFNFSLESPKNVLEIVNIIREIMERPNIEPDIKDTANYEIVSQYLDSSRAHEILNWDPQFTLETGMKETIEWYKNYFQSNS